LNLPVETIIIAVANVGAVIYLVKRVVDRVDKHSDILPQVVESLRTINESQKTTAAGIKELFASRNEHAERLKEIETTHKINKCDAGGRRGYDPACRTAVGG
jgi:hypothetical protein